MKNSKLKEYYLLNCCEGNHPFEKVYATNNGYDEIIVVRWCPICGSVVVDIDKDGRTYAGNVRPFKSPQILEEL